MKFIIAFLLYSLVSLPAMAQIEVIISGGFSGPYQELLPSFEKSTGIKVTTKSGASQGAGPKTIKAQLAAGTTADIVILSREGLAELIEQNRIQPGSDRDLAQAPLGLAVPTGSQKPDISSTKAFTQALIKAKKIAVPGSTSGLYLVNELFPKLGVQNQIDVQVTERGTQSAALVANRQANMAIQPSSELVNVTGIDYVGALPNDIQLIQTFAAALTKQSTNPDAAQKLIDFLSSPNARGAIERGGMTAIR